MSRKLLVSLGVITAVAVGGAFWAHPHIAPLPEGARADLLVVEKGTHTLSAYSSGKLLRTYTVSLGREPLGPKLREGDHRTPEGQYTIDGHNQASGYHRALHISYPSPSDLARARAGGYAPGGNIMVHGIRNGLGWLGRAHLLVNWTVGCVAVTNSEIEELYRIVPDGTAIEIRP